jgi:hypothetical protein
MPRVAAILEVQQISDVMGIENENSKSQVKNLMILLGSKCSSVCSTDICRKCYPNGPVVG